MCATGSNIAVIKETTLDAASFSVGRFVIAAVVFAPFLKDAVKEPGLTEAGLELGVWAGIGFLAQALGLMTTDAGRASFFTTFTVRISALTFYFKNCYEDACSGLFLSETDCL